MRECERDDGLLFAVAGMSRHGKSSWIMSHIKKHFRILVWDPRGEYTKIGCEMVRSIPELSAKLKTSWTGAGRLSYWGPLRDFDAFCQLGFAWIQLWPAIVVVDEVADVTSSAAGRGAWGELVRKGLFYGAHIYAATTRPQETDKTTWANASVKHCHTMELPTDCEYMARVLGVTPEDLANLPKYDYIERHAGTREVFRGRLQESKVPR